MTLENGLHMQNFHYMNYIELVILVFTTTNIL